MDTCGHTADILIAAPVRQIGIESNSMRYSLAALAALGIKIDLYDATPRTGTRQTSTNIPAWLRDLINVYKVRVIESPSESSPRVLCAMHLDPQYFVGEMYTLRGDRPLLWVEEPQSAMALQLLDVEAETLLDSYSTMAAGGLFLVAGSAQRRKAFAAVKAPMVYVAAFDSRFGPGRANDDAGPRPLFHGERRTIGRHVFGEGVAWLESETDLQAAYPTEHPWQPLFLGRMAGLRKLVGEVPKRWQFDSDETYARLQDYDYWIFGSSASPTSLAEGSIEEALAAGAVVVLPPEYRAWFGSAATYASRVGVRAALRALEKDRTGARNLSRRALHFSEKTSPQQFVEWVADVVLDGIRTKSARRYVGCEPRDRGVYRIAFVTSNGAGMGHLTRLLGIARQLPHDIRAEFISLSSAVPVVATFGYSYSYISSRYESGLSAEDWNAYARTRFQEEFARVQPDLIVFDGTWPYRGFLEAALRSGALLSWCLRGMWRPHTKPTSLRQGSKFDVILRPEDVAEAVDSGPTSRVASLRCPPITVLAQQELLTRSAARAELGIGDSERAVLVTLGAGALNNVEDLIGLVRDEFAALNQKWRVFVTKNPLSLSTFERVGVDTLARYPIADLLPAFDLLVSAAGYNSVHEAIAAAVPAVWLPNMNTQTDDQYARARFIADHGAGVCVVDPDAATLKAALHQISHDDTRGRMAKRCSELQFANGGFVAARELVALLQGVAE